MAGGLTTIAANTSHYQAYIEKLEEIYEEMDRCYDRAAERYAFQCTGCEDSCCLTLFHHHTLVEFLYLAFGLHGLDQQALAEVNQEASRVKQYVSKAREKPIRAMCPLNQAGRCRLYAYRPMICRLHGIPHQLQQPGRKVARGSGCHVFSEHYLHLPYQPFDRTPHYLQMAELEKALRIETGYRQRLKVTVADMVLLA